MTLSENLMNEMKRNLHNYNHHSNLFARRLLVTLISNIALTVLSEPILIGFPFLKFGIAFLTTFLYRCNDGGPTAPLYSALLSEHNRIAGELYSLNPFWEDNALFLESRRALAAVIQHITYNEFLPVLLGEVRIFERVLNCYILY